MKVLVVSFALIAIVGAACPSEVFGRDDARVRAVESTLPAFDFSTGIPWKGIGAAAGSHGMYERMRAYNVPGVSVAVIDGFSIAWAKGYGTSDAAGSDSVTALTRFEAASTTKTVTAAAVLHLVAEGLIGLDDDVNDLLTSYRVPESDFTKTEKVTVRRLLSHTAGINRPNGGFPRSGAPTAVQVLRGEAPAQNQPLAVESVPGTTYRYSNFGFVLLQQVIEDVARKPYAAVMEETIFRSLEMSSSSYEAAGRAPAGHHDGSGEPAESSLHPSALGQGGLITTPTDLAKLAIAVMRSYNGNAGNVLPPAVAREALTKQCDANPEDMGFLSWGLGTALMKAGEGPVFTHPGYNVPGTTCFYIGIPATGQGAVIMTNAANGLQLSLELLSAIAREYRWPALEP